MNKKISVTMFTLFLLFAVGANAKTVCTTTDETYTETICHIETVEHTETVCHNEFAGWDIFHWFPHPVCEDVTTSEDQNICEDVTKTRPVETCTEIPDTTAPVITLNGKSEIEIKQGQNYIDEGATAQDNEDGDITDHIITVNPVNKNNIGKYIVTYDVSDSAGNEANQVCRYVEVVGGGAVRIPTPPKMINYSCSAIAENTYNCNFVVKNTNPNSPKSFIKWGGSQIEMELSEWIKYKENGNIIKTDSDTIHVWFKNFDGTGAYTKIKVK